MATVPTQVRIDENLKKQATELFSQLGMDMSSAMNIFLRQCVMRGGLPFDVVVLVTEPEYKIFLRSTCRAGISDNFRK